jgi:hypothetical protein
MNAWEKDLPCARRERTSQLIHNKCLSRFSFSNASTLSRKSPIVSLAH